jgi:membrane-associated phospholipid phosphatase
MKKIDKKTIWDFLAFLISLLFSPYVTAAIFILIITYTNSKNLMEFLPWMGIAFVFAIIIPGAYVLWLVEKKEVSDLHLSKHSQRKIPFLFTAVSSLVGALALNLIGAAKPVVVMGVAYAANAVAIALLTQFWKISVHTALYSSVVTVIVIIFGVKFSLLYLILIPLSWSRVYRQRHSLNQVVGGAMMAFVITCLVFWLFHYI